MKYFINSKMVQKPAKNALTINYQTLIINCVLKFRNKYRHYQ